VRKWPSVVLASCSALAVLSAACTSGPSAVGGGVVPSVGRPGPAITYVAIGASETVGIGSDDPPRDGWAYVFYRDALPRAAVFVNLAIPGATTRSAIDTELPHLAGLRPDLVTVWLGVNDIIQGVAPETYEAELRGLVSRVRARTVLIANTPSLGGLPRFANDRGVERTVTAYDAAVSRVAAASGATLVDLGPLADRVARLGTATGLISGDGLHPNAAGYAAIARVFEQTYRAAVSRG
jgi:acyl-CoA thioesterase-1